MKARSDPGSGPWTRGEKKYSINMWLSEASRTCDLVPSLDSLLPEQVGQLLDASTPEQVRQRVEVPDVELVVQRTAEAHANEIRGEENQHNLWLSVKVWYKSRWTLGTSFIYSLTCLANSNLTPSSESNGVVLQKYSTDKSRFKGYDRQYFSEQGFSSCLAPWWVRRCLLPAW